MGTTLRKIHSLGESRGGYDLGLVEELVLEKGRGLASGRKGWGKVYLEGV